MIKNKFNIVMIDDEADFLSSYKHHLEEDFHIHPFTCPREAVNFIENFKVDAVVLDYHIPGSVADDTFMELRMKKFDQPVIFLTGDGRLTSKLSSLELGVDDFLLKPISTAELSAYLNNRIRAYKRKNPDFIQIHNLRLKLSDPFIYVNNEEIALSPKEFEILKLLVMNLNSVVKKTDILKSLWADVKVEENNIDTHMSNLRKKMKAYTGEIVTVKCLGYMMKL